MECSDYRSLLLAYLDGDLAADTRADLDGHLERCPGCRAELQALQETLALVAGIPAPEPSEAFWQQYLREIRLRATPASGTSAWRSWLAPLVLRPIPALVVAGVLVATAALTWLNLPERPALPELASLKLTQHLLVGEDLDVLQEMELLEEMDLLEDWDLLRSRAVPGSRRAA